MPMPECPATLDDAERIIVLKLAVTQLKSPRERIAGLRILAESRPEEVQALSTTRYRSSAIHKSKQRSCVCLVYTEIRRSRRAISLTPTPGATTATDALSFVGIRRTVPWMIFRTSKVCSRAIRPSTSDAHWFRANVQSISGDGSGATVSLQREWPFVQPFNGIECSVIAWESLETMMLQRPHLLRSGSRPLRAMGRTGRLPTTGSAWRNGACGSTTTAS